MNNLFNEDYYERGLEKGVSCYSNYRWIPELTIPMCADILSYLNISESDSILDFGCSKGYLVKAMRLLHRECYGVDISDYAINSCPKDVLEYLFLIKDKQNIPMINNKKYDWTIAKDVLEHVPYDCLHDTLKKIRLVTNNLFIIVPLGKDGKYEIPAYELDITHKIREPLEWWNNELAKANFNVLSSSYKAKYIKSNWDSWEFGNGFIVSN